MTTPNLTSISTITPGTAVQSITTSLATVVANAAASNSTYKINTMYVSNTTGSAVTVSVGVLRSATTYYIAYQISVPSAATLDIVSKYVYLLEGDTLQVTASATGLTAVCSYEILAT